MFGNEFNEGNDGGKTFLKIYTMCDIKLSKYIQLHWEQQSQMPKNKYQNKVY